MEPNEFAIAGVMFSWVIMALAVIVGRRTSRGIRVRYRDPAGLVGFLLQGAGFALAFGWQRPRLISSNLAWGVSVTSVALAVGSSAFLLTAVRTLDKQWSLLPRIVEQHVLVEEGPYSVVRHPIYLAMLGILLSTGLAFGSSSAVVFAVGLYLIGTILRVRKEERLLHQIFGEKYVLYTRRVPTLLPLRWRRKTRLTSG